MTGVPLPLLTPRCILDRIIGDDRDAVAALLVDPRVWRYLGGPKARARTDTIFDAYVRDSARGRVWAVRQRGEARLAGVLFLHDHHDGDDTEVSYLLSPAYWGRGYATEAVGALLVHAERQLGLSRVVAETQSANLASRRVLEKVGMKPERRLIRFGQEQMIYALER
ncbi:GNAT family N-acetyltransferase [Bauldia sp.]|uniref:GNAT family N-acetyltransferase n=1 Tax=Bauldia sp. TaxID=2575872 RepID=UPI003BA93DA6